MVAARGKQPPDPCPDDGTDGTGDAATFAAAHASGRPSDYTDYLARFPAGICAAVAAHYLAHVDELRRALVRVPGIGPLPPRRLTDMIFTGDDYPPQAYAARIAGAVTAEWDVSEIGDVESCHVTVPSASPLLNAATCRIVTRRMRYDPARDSSGAAIRSSDHITVRWSPPARPPELIILRSD